MNSSEPLEFELIAEILSYNVASYVDLAQMRLVSKSLPLAYLLKASGHLKVCHPSKERYYQELVTIREDSCSYEGLRLISTRSTGQDSMEFSHLFELLPPASIQSSLCISASQDFPKSVEIEKDVPAIFSTLKQLNETKSMQEFEALARESLKNGMFFSVNEREKEKGQYDERKREDDTVSWERKDTYAFLLTLVAAKTYVEVQEEGNVRSVLFEAKNKDDVPYDFVMKIADSGSKYRGYIIKDNGREVTCIVPVIIQFFHEDYFYETFSDYDAKYEHIQISSLWSKYQEQTKVEGVAIADKMISHDLHEKLTNQINSLAERSPVDYHPHSRNIVRDLIHPALFAYVKGVSPIVSKPAVPVPDFPVIEYEDIEKEETDVVTDYWGRQYEESLKYQWLPTYFSILDKGQCVIEDYINNLVPRTEHEELYTSSAQLFSQALPLFESVLSYGRSVRPRIRDFDEYGMEYYDEVPADIEEIPHSLRGEKVQVITKIVDYELNSGDTYEGVWHVEGMSHEEIVATAIYFIDRADEIEGGDLLFKRAFHRGEAQYIFSSVDQMRPQPLDDAIETGLMPLGLVQTLNKRLIVFPNSHVHKVTDLKNLGNDMDTGDGVKKRRIIVFFLVNPKKRITSTREVPPQQEIAGGKMSMDDARAHRLELMKERKFTKQDWNVREIELCEH